MSPRTLYRHLVSSGVQKDTARELSGLAEREDRIVGLVLAGITFLFLAYLLVGFIDSRDEDARTELRNRADRAEKTLLSCFTSGIISIDGEAHDCRPVPLGVKL